MNLEKLKKLIPYWTEHNITHSVSYEKWKKFIDSMGLNQVSKRLEDAIHYIKKANKSFRYALELLERIDSKSISERKSMTREESIIKEDFPIKFKKIGEIRTPYVDNAPYQPIDKDEGEFYVELNEEYTKGLYKLIMFRYIYLIYYIHRVKKSLSMIISPSWTKGEQIGVFASRSPVRPNFIGLSIVRIRKIINNRIYTSGLDVFDGTPLIDIKPYIKDLDSKSNANYGWIENLKDKEHLILHIKGIPHDY
ncbi:MAG: tRNA (N6-threonylcarbamoyladenosine(37)-N6)-methyltransferase TrmO [Promethearchaeota archaeon]